MKRRQLLKFCNNKTLVDIYNKNQGDFEKKFPHYGVILNMQFRRGQKIQSVMDSAHRALEKAIHNRLPKNCTERVFKFISIAQLRQLKVQNFTHNGIWIYKKNFICK